MVDGKYKVLVLSDHALSTSGVGTQTRHLITGLLQKNMWSFRQLGAAMKHDDYETIQVTPDFIIKPVDGFGNRDMIRQILVTEKPDLLFIFTDPRFFYWLFEMEDEIHQVCPIVYWHVWDNAPYPEFNDAFYEATDAINCHSYHTYDQVKTKWPNKTKFIPHALPDKLFFPFNNNQKLQFKRKVIGQDCDDHFVGLWINRNARRKRPGDLLWSWSKFINKLEKEKGHRKAKLILHTDPFDQEGPNLLAVAEMLGIKDNIVVSTERVGFEEMNILHNISDFVINISYAEGFGLSTLEAMMTGTPIIAPLTGGQSRQIIDHRDGSENGFALPIEMQTLVGSQTVPYILEDYTSTDTIADRLWKMYALGKEGRAALGKKCFDYANFEFNYQDVVDKWHDSMLETVLKFKSSKRKKSYKLMEI